MVLMPFRHISAVSCWQSDNDPRTNLAVSGECGVGIKGLTHARNILHNGSYRPRGPSLGDSRYDECGKLSRLDR